MENEIENSVTKKGKAHEKGNRSVTKRERLTLLLRWVTRRGNSHANLHSRLHSRSLRDGDYARQQVLATTRGNTRWRRTCSGRTRWMLTRQQRRETSPALIPWSLRYWKWRDISLIDNLSTYTTQSYTLVPITIIFTLLPKYPYINNTIFNKFRLCFFPLHLLGSCGKQPL